MSSSKHAVPLGLFLLAVPMPALAGAPVGPKAAREAWERLRTAQRVDHLRSDARSLQYGGGAHSAEVRIGARVPGAGTRREMVLSLAAFRALRPEHEARREGATAPPVLRQLRRIGQTAERLIVNPLEHRIAGFSADDVYRSVSLESGSDGTMKTLLPGNRLVSERVSFHGNPYLRAKTAGDPNRTLTNVYTTSRIGARMPRAVRRALTSLDNEATTLPAGTLPRRGDFVFQNRFVNQAGTELAVHRDDPATGMRSPVLKSRY